MQREKIALMSLVIVIILVLSAFIIVTNPEIMDNLFGNEEPKEVAELGDCVDVHYVGRYASNDTIFSYSYDDVGKKIGETPLKIFISYNRSKFPPDSYSDYYSSLVVPILIGDPSYADYLLSPLIIKEGFMQALIGMKAGQHKTTDNIPPEKAFGVTPKKGDFINVNLSDLGIPLEINFSIFKIKENETVPPEYDLGVNTTSMYIFRDESHYDGEIIVNINNSVAYTCWEDSTVITDIGDTLIFTYTTPTTNVDENFTWIIEETDVATYSETTTYPTNSSAISSLNDSIIIVTHTPQIGDEITVATIWIAYGGYETSTTYTVVDVTDNKINTSYTIDSEGINVSYQEFDRQTIIQRNMSQNITSSAPGEVWEGELFLPLRILDEDFSLSLSPYADETVYFELEVVNIYKTSQEES